WSWILAEQHADEVFLLCDLTLERRDLAPGAVHKLLRLSDVEQRGHAAAFTHLRELQRLLTRRERPPRDVELEIERAEREVCVRDLADERRQHGAAAPFARQQLRPRGFRGAPVSPPEIEFPRDRSLHLQGSDVLRRETQRDRRTFSKDVDS